MSFAPMMPTAPSAMAVAGGSSAPGPLDDYWYESSPMSGSAGMTITPETALQIPAVWACVRVLADTVASVPLVLYERTNDEGGKRRAYDNPLWSVLHDRPNNWQTGVEFWSMMMEHACLRGAAIAQVIPGPRGAVDQLIPRHPDRVKPIMLADGTVIYEWRPAGGEVIRLMPDEVFVIRWLTTDGYTPYSPIRLMRQPLGLAKAYETHGAKLFENEAKPGRVHLTHPGKMSADAQARLRAQFESVHTGARNWGKMMVFEEGMTAQTLGLAPEDAQFMEGRNYQNADISRIYRVPLHMISDLNRSTNNNIEHQSLDFVKYTMLHWFRLIEQSIGRDLVIDTTRYFPEFAVDALARGDAASRASYYNSGINAGWLTRNEARRLENLNPLPGLDEPLQPLNMGRTGGSDGSGGTSPPPPAPSQHPEKEQASLPASPNPQAEQIIREASGRIASRECLAIGRRIKHAATDRPQFDAWLNEWCRPGHVEAAKRAMVGAVAVCDTGFNAEAVAAQVVDRLVRDMRAERLPAWDAWVAARPTVIAELMRKEFARGDMSRMEVSRA